MDSAERKILDMVESGQISADEGLRLIKAMEAKPVPAAGVASLASTGENEVVFATDDVPVTAIPEEERQRMKRLKAWWVLPFGIGLLITTLGAVWMYTAFLDRGFRFGFWLALVLFFIGIAVAAVSYHTSRSVWLHVRIRQRPGETPQRIAFSLPIPLSLTRWAVRSFGDRIPGIKDQPAENITEILEGISPEEPFYVHVNEGNGEEVEVFIG